MQDNGNGDLANSTIKKKLQLKNTIFFLNFINQTISGGTAAIGGN